jgi:hypothetical protein
MTFLSEAGREGIMIALILQMSVNVASTPLLFSCTHSRTFPHRLASNAGYDPKTASLIEFIFLKSSSQETKKLETFDFTAQKKIIIPEMF